MLQIEHISLLSESHKPQGAWHFEVDLPDFTILLAWSLHFVQKAVILGFIAVCICWTPVNQGQMAFGLHSIPNYRYLREYKVPNQTRKKKLINNY